MYSSRFVTQTVLVRYGELALKSPAVRREFEQRLRGLILRAMHHDGIEGTVTEDHGHFYVHTADPTKAVPVVCRIFGVVSVSVADVLPTDLDELSKRVVEVAQEIPDQSSFAIRARRTGTHPFTSHDVDVRLGADVMRAHGGRGLRVDLTHPGREIAVEIRGPKTYIYMERHAGPGGFPLGVAGRIGAFVDGTRGALGAWLLMKRGCKVYTVSSPASQSLTRVLQRFDPEIDAERTAEGLPAWELLKHLVEQRQLSGVALPLMVDDYGPARAYWGETVLFSPTVGMAEAEVERRWLEIERLAR